jgi:hypothetical protein
MVSVRLCDNGNLERVRTRIPEMIRESGCGLGEEYLMLSKTAIVGRSDPGGVILIAVILGVLISIQNRNNNPVISLTFSLDTSRRQRCPTIASAFISN